MCSTLVEGFRECRKESVIDWRPLRRFAAKGFAFAFGFTVAFELLWPVPYGLSIPIRTKNVDIFMITNDMIRRSESTPTPESGVLPPFLPAYYSASCARIWAKWIWERFCCWFCFSLFPDVLFRENGIRNSFRLEIERRNSTIGWLSAGAVYGEERIMFIELQEPIRNPLSPLPPSVQTVVVKESQT